MKVFLFLAAAFLIGSYDLPDLYKNHLYKELVAVVGISLVAFTLTAAAVWGWRIFNPRLIAELVGSPVNYLLEAWLRLSKPV